MVNLAVAPALAIALVLTLVIAVALALALTKTFFSSMFSTDMDWTHWGLNPGPSACGADVIPLHHVPRMTHGVSVLQAP